MKHEFEEYSVAKHNRRTKQDAAAFRQVVHMPISLYDRETSRQEQDKHDNLLSKSARKKARRQKISDLKSVPLK